MGIIPFLTSFDYEDFGVVKTFFFFSLCLCRAVCAADTWFHLGPCSTAEQYTFKIKKCHGLLEFCKTLWIVCTEISQSKIFRHVKNISVWEIWLFFLFNFFFLPLPCRAVVAWDIAILQLQKTWGYLACHAIVLDMDCQAIIILEKKNI